jgi:hypothetical protein
MSCRSLLFLHHGDLTTREFSTRLLMPLNRFEHLLHRHLFEFVFVPVQDRIVRLILWMFGHTAPKHTTTEWCHAQFNHSKIIHADVGHLAKRAFNSRKCTHWISRLVTSYNPRPLTNRKQKLSDFFFAFLFNHYAPFFKDWWVGRESNSQPLG